MSKSTIATLLVSSALVCTVSGAADIEDARPPGLTGENWQFGPHNRWAYTHVSEVLPTKDIPNSSTRVRPIPGVESAPDDLTILLKGEPIRLSQVMESFYVDGLLVIKDGTAVVERYSGTLTPERTHLMWSITKTVTGLVAATVVEDGLIDLDRTVEYYVPELATSGWGQDTVRDLLDMRDSADWNEDYDAADSTVRRQDCADGLLSGDMCSGTEVVGNYEFLQTVGRAESQQGTFSYKSGTTDVMAWVLEAATERRFADLVSERIWKPMGAERSASITVDVSGFTLASGGMSATLRDLARLGLLMINRGRAGDEQVVPAAWIGDIFDHPGDTNWPADVFRLPDTAPYYRSFVWGIGDGRGTVRAIGVHGQHIYVAPSTNTVIAMFSSLPDPFGSALGIDSGDVLAMLRAVEEAVN